MRAIGLNSKRRREDAPFHAFPLQTNFADNSRLNSERLLGKAKVRLIPSAGIRSLTSPRGSTGVHPLHATRIQGHHQYCWNEHLQQTELELIPARFVALTLE
jgi:hypothetical protein